MIRLKLLMASLLATTLATGCAQSRPAIVPVEGVLLLDGQPVPHAEIQFVPMERGLGAEYIAAGTTDAEGRFTLLCNGQAGACACENRVVVADASPPESARGQSSASQVEMTRFYAGLKNRPIPVAYTSAGRTPVTVAVNGERGEYRIELRR
jgi:hypothetical protein